MMGSTIRRHRLGGALVALAITAGCQCQPTQDECTVKTVRFITPTDMAQVNPNIDVQVEGLNANNERVAVESATLSVRAEGAAQAAAPLTGQLETNVATFRGVMLQSGLSTLEAKLKQKMTCAEVSGSVVVNARSAVTVPKVTRVSFPQDGNNDGVLNAAEWPVGSVLRVQVQAAEAFGLSVQIKQGAATPGGPIAISTQGSATVELSRLMPNDVTQGTLDFFAELTDGSMAKNNASGNPEAVASIQVRRAAPTCANTTRLLNGPMQDADPNRPGFQLRATGTVGANVTQVAFTIPNVASASGSNAGGMTSADLTLPATGDAQYQLTLTATDASGNACVDTKQIRVDLDAPTVVITQPARVDGGAALVTSSPVTVTATTNSPSGMACFFRRQGTAPRTQIGCAAVSNGMATLQVSFPSSGSFEVTVEITDDAGNVGTASVPLNVNLGGCGVSFTQPAMCPTTFFSSDLVDGGVAVAFTGGNCASQPARLLVNSAVSASGTIGVGETFGPVVVPLSTGSNTLRAEATNLQGGTDFATCDVTLDTSIPTFVDPAAPADGGVALVNASQDSNTSTAGAQRVLSFTANVPTGGRVDVCTTQATDPVTSAMRAACADGASGWFTLRTGATSPDAAFTFPEGSYSLKLVVVSGTRFNVSAALPLRVDVTVPCVADGGLSFDRDNGATNTAFAQDGRLNIAEYGQSSVPFVSFVLGCGETQASLASSNGVVLRQVVSSSVDDLESGLTQSVSFSGGRVNVALIGLTGTSSRTFFVELRDQAGNVNVLSGPVDVAAKALAVDLQGPTCSLTNPTGSLLGPSQVPAGVLTASLNTSADVVDGGVTFTLTGPSTPSPQSQTLSSGVATATFAVSGDATWNLAARCLDPAGNRADTTTWTGRIDLVAPSVVITAPSAPADGGVALVTTSPTTATITSDAASGQACFFLRQGTGMRTQLGCVALSGGGASQAVSFPASGAYELSVDVTDPAGNLGTSLVNLNANLAGCAVAFTQPAACGATVFGNELTDGGLLAAFTGGNCVGQPARLFVNATQVSSGSISAGATYGPVLAPLSNGLNTIRAEATNLQTGVDFATCDVTVDLSVPTFVSPIPAADGGVVAINSSQDGQSAVPGAQRSLVFTANVPPGGRVDVCTTQAVDPVTSTMRAACADGQSGWYLLRASAVTPETGFTFPNGDYSLRLVVVLGSRFNSSAPMPVSVDVARPCVGVGGLRFDRDNGASVPANANDAHVNVAEYAQTTLPFVSFPIGCGDSQSTLSQTTAVVVRQVVAGSVVNLPSGVTQTVSFASGRINVSLAGLTGEATRTFFAELTDQAGNKNLYGGTGDLAAGDLDVDLVAPTCSITAPVATLLGPSQVPSGVLGVSVSTASDVSTGGVTFSLTGPSSPPAQNVNVGGGVATASFNVTGDNTWALTASCRDQAGNTTPATAWNGRIDLQAPTCSITAPVPGSTSTVRNNAISVTVGGAEGRTVTVQTNVPPSTVLATLTVSSGVASGNAQFNNGTQTLTATVDDAVGNQCQATGGFTVAAPNCNLTVSGLFSSSSTTYWVNQSTASITSLSANTSDCGAGKTVTLTRLPSTVVGTQMTNGSGNVTFTGFAPVHGESYTVSINDGSGNITTVNVNVDTQVPVVSGVSINGATNFAADGGIRLVAATTNANIRANAAGFFVDQAPGTPGGQFTPQATSVTGAIGGVMRATLGAATLATEPISADGPVSFSSPLTVAQHAAGALNVVVVDQANNTAPVLSGQLLADVIAPGAVTPTFATPTRSGSLGVSWTAVVDDVGDSASGPPTSHEVRWTTSSVPANAEMQSETDYFATVSVVEALLAGTATSTTLTLPPLNKYFVAVRAIDEVGNYGAFVAPPAGASAVSNLWNTITLTDTTANSLFGNTVGLADLNGDTFRDVVVSAQGGNGAIYVYSGGAGLANQTGCTTGCQKIDPPSGTGFGHEMTVDGDFDDDGRNDLVVSQQSFAAPVSPAGAVGRVLVYWGVASGTISTTAGTFLEFQGDTQSRSFGATARFIGDVDADGFDDLAIAATGWKNFEPDGGALLNANEAGLGRVYIFRGRARASWPNRALLPSDATWVLEGPNPRFSTTNAYGTNRHGLTRLGDINGDGQADFTVPMSRQTSNRLQLWNARTLHDPMVVVIPPALFSSAQALQVLSPDPTTSNTAINGYAAAALGGLNVRDLTMTPRLDLLVGHPFLARVDLHLDLAATGTSGAPVAIQGSNFFGSIIAAGDLNQDGRMDLAVGEGGTAPTSGWVLFQQPNGSFGTQIGTAPNPWVAQLKGATGTSLLGTSVAIGDVTGDGSPDFVIGDRVNGIQTVTVKW